MNAAMTVLVDNPVLPQMAHQLSVKLEQKALVLKSMRCLTPCRRLVMSRAKDYEVVHRPRHELKPVACSQQV